MLLHPATSRANNTPIELVSLNSLIAAKREIQNLLTFLYQTICICIVNPAFPLLQNMLNTFTAKQTQDHQIFYLK